MRGKWGEATYSKYTFYMIQLVRPTDGENGHMKLIMGFWHFFISLNLWKVDPYLEFGKDAPRYGFAFHDDVFWIHYGEDRCFAIDMPWQWEIVRHDLLLPDGSVYHSNRWSLTGKKIDKHCMWWEVLEGWPDQETEKSVHDQCTRTRELEHYTKDGRKQVAKIRMAGEEREWRWKWFKWLPFPRMIRRTVDCWSDAELGERAGSWKGGMMGWSVPWEKDESMNLAFSRWYRKWDGN